MEEKISMWCDSDRRTVIKEEDYKFCPTCEEAMSWFMNEGSEK